MASPAVPAAKKAAAVKAVPTAKVAKAAPVKAAPAKRATPAKRAAVKGHGAILAENHTAGEAVAHAIIMQYEDLKPSVNRIMAADLSEESLLIAITLFRDSLDVPGDKYRYPANAIEGGRQMVAIPAAQ